MGALGPGRSLTGGSILKLRQRLRSSQIGDILHVEEASGPVSDGFVTIRVWVDAEGAELEGDAPQVAKDEVCGTYSFLMPK
jgi:hypothetical protein